MTKFYKILNHKKKVTELYFICALKSVQKVNMTKNRNEWRIFYIYTNHTQIKVLKFRFKHKIKEHKKMEMIHQILFIKNISSLYFFIIPNLLLLNFVFYEY